MQKRFISAIILLICSVLTISLYAQEIPNIDSGKPAQSQPTTTIRSTTRLVQISVIVTGKNGEPVTGLKQDDFTVLDQGKPQQIAFFSEAKPAPATEKRLLPTNVFTNRYDLKGQDPGAVTVVLFDLLNTSTQDQSRVRQQLIDFLKNLKPQDHVAMYGLTTQLYLLHEFTQDASELVKAANRIRPEQMAAYDASHPQLFDVPALANDPHSMFARFQEAVNEANARTADFNAQNRVETTAVALMEIANHVATIPGRKNLVWVSGSFPLIINPGEYRPDRKTASLQSYVNRATQALNRANVAVYPVDATGVTTSPNMDPQQPANKSALHCADCTMEASGVAPAMYARQNARDSEREMAASTGGQAFYGSNNIVPAMTRAFDDGRYAYTIGFYPNHGDWHGEFRKIKIETKTDGAKLRYREGYLAEAASNGNNKEQARLALQQTAISPLDATGLGMIVSAKWSSTAGDKKVEFHIGIDPKQLLLRPGAGDHTGEIDLFVVQRNAKGEIIAAEDQPLKLKLEEKQYEYLSHAGMVLERHMKLLPQTSEVRILARDARSGTLGSVTIPIDKLNAALGTAPALKLQNLK